MVVSINDCLKHNIRVIDVASGERLGIVCPIYDWDIPWVIADFLKECTFVNLPTNCYVYTVFTCGKSSGYAYETVSGILSEKGMALSAAYAVCMPDTYIPMFPLASVEQQKKQLEKAEATVIRDGHPIWTEDNCACCLARLHRCPEQAIQYGRKTEKTGRYTNPNIQW